MTDDLGLCPCKRLESGVGRCIEGMTGMAAAGESEGQRARRSGMTSLPLRHQGQQPRTHGLIPVPPASTGPPTAPEIPFRPLRPA